MKEGCSKMPLQPHERKLFEDAALHLKASFLLLRENRTQAPRAQNTPTESSFHRRRPTHASTHCANKCASSPIRSCMITYATLPSQALNNAQTESFQNFAAIPARPVALFHRQSRRSRTLSVQLHCFLDSLDAPVTAPS